MKLYLASRSPRRRELLDQIGVAYECLDVEIDEHWDGKETAREYVARLAQEKAQAGLLQLKSGQESIVLAADTSVVLDDVILGKATTEAEAISMLSSLSGRCHHVYTGVALAGKDQQICVNLNRVFFRSLTEEECQRYCATSEPLGKAGGYAVQGLGAMFIERIEGSYSGIMGLPLFETASMLNSVGIKTV